MKRQFNPEIWQTERKRFNPAQWLPKKTTPKNNQRRSSREPVSKFDEVEIVVSRIEDARIDLTCNYADWLKLAFALADEFGESGRDFFHRISKFYSGYNPAETDRQFNKCLKGNKRSGATIKSLFAAALDAGINVKI